jgi:hypothetical protein
MMDITPKSLTDDERRYWEQQELFEQKCAERAAELIDEPPDSAAAIRAAQEVVADLAAVGIRKRLYQARDEIDRILSDREEREHD